MKQLKFWAHNICRAFNECFAKALAVFAVRQRYVLTKETQLRWRFKIPLITGVCALFLTATAPMAGSLAAYVQKITPLSVAGSDLTEVDSIEQRYLSNRKRLNRYGQSAENIPDDALGEIPAVLLPKHEQIEIARGDTMAGVLEKAGTGSKEAYKIVEALKEHYDPRYIKPGQKIELRFDPSENGKYNFTSLAMALDPVRSVEVLKNEEGAFKAHKHEKAVMAELHAGKAKIQTSLYGSALRASIPEAIIADTIRIYSWDVDFQRDIRSGDQLEVLYEQMQTEDGHVVKSGNVIYARLNVNGEDIPVYRFEMKNGDVDYFTKDGKSIRKALMKTPINGARLSSGYGMRRHPVLGYNKMHKGTDFAAPTGTPIYAAGDGTVEHAGRKGAYGNYIRVRHNSSLKTAYAHLNGFAKGVRAGKRVRQGQTIGYVGSTGRSTGPHLHYEVLKNGVQVNPKSIKLPQGETLRGEQLKTFQAHANEVDRKYAAVINGGQYAMKNQKNSKRLN